MAQAIAALYASPYLHPAALPLKLLQSIMMISLSFIIAGIFYFTYEYRFKRTNACGGTQAVQALHKLYGKLRGFSGGKRGQETPICVAAHARA
jgi:hypothetical protein